MARNKVKALIAVALLVELGSASTAFATDPRVSPTNGSMSYGSSLGDRPMGYAPSGSTAENFIEHGGNSITLNQSGQIDIANIFVFGSDPPVSVTQTGTVDVLRIVEIGGSPNAVVSQSGLRNSASIYQSGFSNSLSLRQVGSSNSGSVLQLGMFNSSFVSQR
jgi:minor curlin subunit